MSIAAFESRRADTLRPGDTIHTRHGARTVVGVRATPRTITITVTDDTLGEAPLMFVPADLVHTERTPRPRP